MKFSATKTDLLAAVKIAFKAAGAGKEVPETGGVLIEANADTGIITVTGTDIRTQIQRRLQAMHIEEGGSIVLKTLFLDMLRLIDSETVELCTDGRCVNIHGGTTLYTLSFMDPKGFPKIKAPFPSETVHIQGIHSLIKQTVFAAEKQTTDPNRQALQFVKLTFQRNRTLAEATNGTCIAVASDTACADGDIELILHEKALQTLTSTIKANEDMYVGIMGPYALFMTKDTCFHTLLHAGKYTEASRLAAILKPEYEAVVNAEDFYRQVDNISSIFSPGTDHCVNLRIERDGVFVQAVTSIGTSRSCIAASQATATPPEGFHYQVRYLLECLSHTTGSVRLLLDQKGFMMLQCSKSFYLISPRGPARISVQQPKKSAAKKRKATAKAAA